MNEKYFRDKQLEYNEHNDCGVRAIAVSTGLTYDEAHAALIKAGRKPRGTCWVHDHIKPALHELGFEMIEESFPGKTIVTLERDLKRYARGRRFFITVRSHFVAFDGEQIVDWSQGRRHRVRIVYRIKQVNTAKSGTETRRFVVAKKPIEHTQGDLKMVDHTQGEVFMPREPWLRKMLKPKGAPKIGTTVKQTIANNETFTGLVTGYLASQFIIKTATGERIIAVGDDWIEI